MAKREIRIGKVSKINYEKGMARVTYPDLDDSVTAEVPVFSFTDEYKMPKVGQEVLVLHLSNGQAAGILLGKYWNKDNTPPPDYGQGKNVFNKEIDEEFGKVRITYKDKKLTLYDEAGDVETEIVSHNKTVKVTSGDVSINVTDGNINLNATNGDINLNTVNGNINHNVLHGATTENVVP